MGWLAAVPAIAGALGGLFDSRSAEKASRNAGRLDRTTTADPWGPTVGTRQDLIGQLPDLLSGVLGNSQVPDWLFGGGGGRGGGGGGGGWQPTSYDTGGGGTAPAPFGYGDPRVQDLLTSLSGANPDQFNSAYSQFLTGQLGGQANPFINDAYSAFSQSRNQTPELDAMMRIMLGELGGGGQQQTPNAAYGAVGGWHGGGGGGGGNFQFEDPIGTQYMLDVLEGKYLNEANPHRDAMIDSLTSRIRQEYEEGQIPGLNQGFAGMGRLGSDTWERAMAGASQSMTDALSDAIVGVQYGEYEQRMADLMEAMGMGNQRDISERQIAAQLHEGAANRAASGAAGRRASAGNAAALQSQERLQQLGLLAELIGMGMEHDRFGLGGMGDLASLFTGAQQDTLSQIPGLSQIGIGNMNAQLAPFMGYGEMGTGLQGAQMQIDAQERMQGRELTSAEKIAIINANAQMGSARIGSRASNRALDADLWRFQQQFPLDAFGQVADILNALGLGGGTERVSGYDYTNQQPYTGSVLGQTIAGGLGGLSFGKDFAGLFGGG